MFYSNKPYPFIWGHRGLPSEAVENTRESFLAAQKYGLQGFEFDVQFSKDGVPFVYHDDNLRRLAGRDEEASALTWEDLQLLRLRDPARPGLREASISSLDELFDFASADLFMNLEIKRHDKMDKSHLSRILDVLKAHDVASRTLVSSFQHEYLVEIGTMDPSLQLAALWVEAPGTAALNHLSALTHVMHIAWSDDLEDAVRWLHKRSCQVGVYGVHGLSDVQRCHGLEVEGIFVDDPSWIKTFFKGR